MGPELERSEPDLLVFISSWMGHDMTAAREMARQAINELDFGRSWAFEYTPASSESAREAYLRKVDEADFVVWLAGSTTTPPVENEVNRCMATNGRLLVFKLPAVQRDCRTEALLHRVGQVLKWQEVASISVLGTHIKSALADEVVRALRDPAQPARTRTLLANRDWSFAECEMLWRAVKVSDSLAGELARDAAIGNVLPEVLPGLNVVVGPQGSGKTLATYRLFQRTVELALEDSASPFPVFFKAADVRGNLRDLIEDRCHGYVVPQVQPVTVIIDGLDERGAGEATSLLRDLETYVIANPLTTAVVTVRPLPRLQHNGYVIEMCPLRHEQTVGLIGKVSGKGLPEILPVLGQNSLHESARFPLFAVMLGLWLRDNEETSHVSTYRLVEHVAETAPDGTSSRSETTDTLLQRLAVRAITSGTRVRPLEVARNGAARQQLEDSRLVYEMENGFDFALPIFREWYAARAILEQSEEVENMDLTSERWAIPLSIVAHSEDAAAARDVMERIAATNPAIAGVVLEDDEQAWYLGGVTPSVPSTAAGVGEELRNSMELWAEGLGSLFGVIGPTGPEGELATVGVMFGGERLAVGWHTGSEALGPVVEFTTENSPMRRDARWQLRRDWPAWTTGGIPPTELWAWVMTKRYLVRNLKEALEGRRLSYVVPEALQELAWEFGLVVSGDPWRQESQPSITAALERIRQLPEDPRTTMSARGKYYSWHEIVAMRDHLLSLSRDGSDALHDPWPTADLPSQTASGWSNYSDQRLLDRTTAVYAAALKIYQEMVERWFSPFAERLRLYRLLPVRLEGLLTKHEIDGMTRPALSWRPVILPKAEESHVAFDLGDWSDRLPDIEGHFEEQRESFLRLRRGDPDNGVLFYVGASALNVRSPRPATELAHDWLTEELKDLGWAD